MSGLTYTAEQQRALATRDVPVAVDAGAGCGKTFVLTERFLSHLKPGEDGTPPVELGELVAITFTDAAAREMRDRIRKKCRERLAESNEVDSGYWRRLLRALDTARVSTIHAFASALIREHAIELGVDPAFTVLDPAEAEVLKSASVDDALRERLTPRDGRLDEDLIDTAAHFELPILRSHVRSMIDQAHRPEFARWLRKTPENLVAAWLAYYRSVVAPQYARDVASDPNVSKLRDLMIQATPVKDGFADRLADLADALTDLGSSDDPDAELKRLQPLLYFRDPETRKDVCGVKDWPSKELKTEFTAALKALRERLEKNRRAGDPASMLRAAELGLEVLRVAATAAKRFRAAKASRGVLDNDDLLIEAHRLLTAPDLAEASRRVGDRVKVLLVDEFQDTDHLQAELVQAIAGEPREGNGRLFLVGDFKQSIYRFRGAEPDVFRTTRRATPKAGRLTLSKNFRSTPAVLDFVNTLFAPIFGDEYQPLRPAREQLTEPPAVELLWTPPPEDAPAPAQRRAEAASIAGRLRELLDGGGQVVVDEQTREPRPVRPGDVAVLFRALSDVAAYEEALRDAGIEYYLVGGHAFYAQQEVYDVLNLLRTVTSECDDITLAGVLRSPMFGLTDESLFWLSRGSGLSAGLFARTTPLELGTAQRQAVEHAREILAGLRRDKERLPAAELLRRAWDATGYDAALLAEFLGERKLANLEKLHEQARQTDAAGGGLRELTARLTEFVHQPPKEALAATTAEDAGVVRLMTVHASKGLEFPVVVLPDLDRKTQSNKTAARFDPILGPLVKPADDPLAKSDAPPVGIDFWRATERAAEDAERDRLFYVACTRAADRLILSSCLDPAAEKLEGPWLKRLAERFDLASGEPLDAATQRLVTVTRGSKAPPVEATKKPTATLAEAVDQAASAAASTPALPDSARPTARRPADIKTFSVSRLDGRLQTGVSSDGDREPPLNRDSVDPRRLGTLVHAILERLDPTQPATHDAVVELAQSLAPQHLRRRLKDGIAAAVRLAERGVVSEVWQAMGSAAWLGREVDFTLPWPSAGATLRGYLDALYRDSDGRWHVVDYKTNSIPAAAVPEVAQRYALQMAVYAHAVEAAIGEPPASLTLMFLGPGVAHAIPWDADARQSSRLVINQAIAQARQQLAETPS